MKIITREKFLAIFSAAAFGLFLTGCFSRANPVDLISKNPVSSAAPAGSGSKTSESANTSKETEQSIRNY